MTTLLFMHGTATYKSMKFEAMNFRESLTAGLASVNGIGHGFPKFVSLYFQSKVYETLSSERIICAAVNKHQTFEKFNSSDATR